MTKNMSDLLKTIVEDKGAIVNKIIKGKIFTADEIVDYAFETNDKDIIGAAAAHIKGISNDNMEKLTDFIIATKDPMLATKFAAYNQKAPKKTLQNFVINSKDPEAILTFAMEVEEAEIQTLAQAIIEINNPNYIYFFIRDIEDAPIEKLVDALVNTNNILRIYEAAKNIRQKYIEQGLELLTLNKKNEIKKMENFIIKTKNAKWIYAFAMDVCNSYDLETAIIETQEINYIQQYMLNVRSSNTGRLLAAIERIKISNQTKNNQMEILFNAVVEGNIEKISAASDIYRGLFLDETLDENLVENAKKRVLTKQPGQGMRTKPQFPGERKLKK